MEWEEIKLMKEAIELFAIVVGYAAPYAVVFALGQRLVNLFLGMAFNGRIDL